MCESVQVCLSLCVYMFLSRTHTHTLSVGIRHLTLSRTHTHTLSSSHICLSNHSAATRTLLSRLMFLHLLHLAQRFVCVFLSLSLSLFPSLPLCFCRCVCLSLSVGQTLNSIFISHFSVYPQCFHSDSSESLDVSAPVASPTEVCVRVALSLSLFLPLSLPLSLSLCRSVCVYLSDDMAVSVFPPDTVNTHEKSNRHPLFRWRTRAPSAGSTLQCNC